MNTRVRPPDVKEINLNSSNLTCHLIQQGCRAALTVGGRGSTRTVLTEIEGEIYFLQVCSGVNGLSNLAWKRQGSERILLTDPITYSNPTKKDKYVLSLLQRAPSLPLSPIPEGGLPEEF